MYARLKFNSIENGIILLDVFDNLTDAPISSKLTGAEIRNDGSVLIVTNFYPLLNEVHSSHVYGTRRMMMELQTLLASGRSRELEIKSKSNVFLFEIYVSFVAMYGIYPTHFRDLGI